METVTGLVEINGKSLKGLDFTGAQLNGWRLRNCEVVDCTFTEAKCVEWALWNSSVRNCSFVGANLRHSLLGTYPHGGHVLWQKVNFARVDLRDVSAYGAIFRDCDFSQTRLHKAQFSQCEFSKCRFAGRVEGVLFEGRELEGWARPVEMDSVDFSDAQFVNVEFRGYMLNNIVLPRDPDIFLVRHYVCAAKRAISALSGNASAPADKLRALLEHSVRGPQNADSSHVFNRRDWRTWGGEELLELAETTIKRGEAQCSS